MVTSSPPSPEVFVDTSNIYKHPVFRCANLVQTQAYLRTALIEHELRSGVGEVDSALYMAGTGRVKLMVLRYGPAVEITPRPFQGFSLVQVPLRGSMEIESDGCRVQLGPNQSALISPRRQLRLAWSRDCEQLIVRVPNSLVHRALQEGEYRGRESRCEQDFFSPVTLIAGAFGRHWNTLVQALINLAARSDDGLGERHLPWIEHIELSAALLLLEMQREFAETGVLAERGALGERERFSGSHRKDPLVSAERYMRSRLFAPIALRDLARAAGVSTRTLHVHCKRRYGVGPMVWLRNLRLDVARERLQQNRSAHVTEVAMSCGFGHLGRFAEYYRERFGELPRDTTVV